MMQNNADGKAAMMAKIASIHRVEGFDPAPFAVDYTDLATGEMRKRLPVMIQIAWFRLKYPEGRISVQVTPAENCFVATARVYPSCKDPADAYLAEATASRGSCEDKPSVSPREWAQTAAVGIALRNAGFGLQFAMAGEDIGEPAENELPSIPSEEYTAACAKAKPEPKELTPEEQLEAAMKTLCPIAKFSGKTLGEVLTLDPGAIKWVASRFTGDKEIQEAARFICEYAMQQATA